MISTERVRISAAMHGLATTILNDWHGESRAAILGRMVVLHDELRLLYKAESLPGAAPVLSPSTPNGLALTPGSAAKPNMSPRKGSELVQNE